MSASNSSVVSVVSIDDEDCGVELVVSVLLSGMVIVVCVHSDMFCTVPGTVQSNFAAKEIQI